VVARQLHQVVVAKQIRTRMAHVHEEQLAAGDINRRQRRPQNRRVAVAGLLEY
jgi:hypothetical protein